MGLRGMQSDGTRYSLTTRIQLVNRSTTGFTRGICAVKPFLRCVCGRIDLLPRFWCIFCLTSTGQVDQIETASQETPKSFLL